MLESLVGHGVHCQGKDYEIVGATGGDAYQAGGLEVFDVFDLSDYTFYEIKRGGVAGNVIENSYQAQGVFKLRSGLIRGQNTENVEQGATLHIRPSEAFVEPLGTNREHITLTLNPTDFSGYGSSS